MNQLSLLLLLICTAGATLQAAPDLRHYPTLSTMGPAYRLGHAAEAIGTSAGFRHGRSGKSGWPEMGWAG